MFFSRTISSAFVAIVLCVAAGSTAVAQELAASTDAASDLPFKRSLGVKGVVSGSLEESVRAAGVPVMTVAELLLALAEAIDLDRDIHDGDRFYVRYEQTFNLNDTPADGGRVLWGASACRQEEHDCAASLPPARCLTRLAVARQRAGRGRAHAASA